MGDMSEMIDVTGREKRVKEFMAEIEAAALLVTDPKNITWLTGFTGSSGYVVIDDSITLITDRRYEGRAPNEVNAVKSSAEVVVRESYKEAFQEVIRVETLALEPESITLGFSNKVGEWLSEDGSVAPKIIQPQKSLSELRAIKDTQEIQRISFAAALVDQILTEHLESLIVPGMSEADIAARLGAEIRSKKTPWGYADIAFPIIVASGPNSAIPHHEPSERALENSDFVTIDIGAKVGGYMSDMTRTIRLGTVTEEQNKIYEAVAAAQKAGVESLRDQIEAVEVDQRTRAVIDDAGYGDYFTHGTGHGLGLAVHESPFLSKTSSEIVHSGAVVTVEPGIYVPAIGGVRVEDSCVVKGDIAEVLTHFPKGLVL